MSKNNSDFKQILWKAADSLRAQMDAAEYKHIVLGLIFLKYISDSFTKQKEKIKEMVTDPKSDFFISENLDDINEQDLEDRDYYTQDNVFWVPNFSSTLFRSTRIECHSLQRTNFLSSGPIGLEQGLETRAV